MIRRSDNFESWIDLFLDALIEQSSRSIEMIDLLFEYRRYIHESETDRNVIRLAYSLFANPFIMKSDVAEICKVHPSTAGKIVDDLVTKGILVETAGRKRNQMFVCQRIMDILDSY